VLFTIGVDTESFHARMPKEPSTQAITDMARVLCNTRQSLTLVESKPSERYFRFSTVRSAQKADPNVPFVEVICRLTSPYSKETTKSRFVIRIDTDKDELLMLAEERWGHRLAWESTFVPPADNVEYLFEDCS
jgi:hypothetical protein